MKARSSCPEFPGKDTAAFIITALFDPKTRVSPIHFLHRSGGRSLNIDLTKISIGNHSTILMITMDALLSRLGVQAMNYAIRSGLALTSTYAISHCSRLMKTVDNKGLLSELKTLRKMLDYKIHIISPAIDLIEFK